MNNLNRSFLIGVLVLLLPVMTEAAYFPLTYRYDHHLFTLDPDSFPSWRDGKESGSTVKGNAIMKSAHVESDTLI